MSIRSSFRRIAASAALLGLALPPQMATAADLPRSHLTLTSATSVDLAANTVTLPLHRGSSHGKTVWYIVTDSSGRADATKRGANFAPLLSALDPAAVQTVKGGAAGFDFPAAPDFAPARVYVPSATGFPPSSAAPGATGGEYTPFVRAAGSPIVLDTPIVATGDGPFDVTRHTNTQDRVVRIDPRAKTVSLLLAHGFAAGKPVVYLSTEASDPGASAIERATYTPRLAKVERGTIAIFVVANGSNQGLGYSALGGLDRDATETNAPQLRSPLNVLATFPAGAAAAGYSPLWTANIGEWTAAAKEAKRDAVLARPAAVLAAADAKTFTGPGGKAYGPSGVNVNCPVVAFVDASP